MENNSFDLIKIVNLIWDSRKRIIIWTVIGFAVGIIIAISIPRKYTTAIVVAPENKSLNSFGNANLLAGMIGVGNIAENGLGLNIYPEIIKSTPFQLEFYDMKVHKQDDENSILLHEYLENDIRSPWWSYIISLPSRVMGLFRNSQPESSESPKSSNRYILDDDKKDFVSKLSQIISITNDKNKGIVLIEATTQDPVVAAIIADSLTVELQKYMTEYSTGKTRHDLGITQKNLEEARKQYVEAETAYARAMDQNQNLIQKSAQIKVDMLSNERNIAFSTYQQLATQLELLKIKLQEDTPIVTVLEPAKANPIASSPRRKIIVVAMGFLFAIGYVGYIVGKQLLATIKTE